MSAPQTTPASLTVAENAAATAIGIVAPTGSGTLTVRVTGLPTDGGVFLADGVTAVTNGEVLTTSQLTGLTFKPTTNLSSQSSQFTYSVEDTSGLVGAGYATLGINAAPAGTGTLVVSAYASGTATFIVKVNGSQVGGTQTASSSINTNFTLTGNFGTASTVEIDVTNSGNLYVNTLNLDGTVYLSGSGEESNNGGGPGSGGNALGYKGKLTFVVGSGLLTTTPAAATFAEGNAPAAIGITAPVDVNYGASSLTVVVTGLPTNGTLYLANGSTPVFNGEVLTAAQLAGLTFSADTGAAGTISNFTYVVTDPTGAGITAPAGTRNDVTPGPPDLPGSPYVPGVAGVATLSVVANSGEPVTTPATLSVSQNAAATAIGITAPTGSGTLTATVLALPEEGPPVSGTVTPVGTVTLADGVTPVTVGETLTMAQLTSLKFTPATGDAAFSTAFTYAVSDTSGNSSLGTAILNILPVGASNTILTVGVGPTVTGSHYNTISAAVGYANTHAIISTIQVDAGTYTNDFASITGNITLEGVGGMVNMIATTTVLNSKGMLITNGNDTINNFSFTGATVDASSANGAAIRDQAGNLVLNNDFFFNNQNGILGGANGTTVTINNSMFANNGVGALGPVVASGGTGYTHNLYVGGNQLTVNNSYFYSANIGNEIKSRALNTTITNSRFIDGPGTASYEIDIPNGGNTLIQNNVIEQGPYSQQSVIIDVGAEGALHPTSSIVITGNIIINDQTSHAPLGVNNLTSTSATITNNQFFGVTSGQVVSGPNTQSGNTLSSVASEPALSTIQPFAQVACFLRGTLILMERGEVAVEALAVGDRVVTLSGEAKPIRWIGRRAYDGRFVTGNRAVLPIRVAAGALADDVPARDLWVSPEHALYIDGALAPACQLVNGATITQAESVDLVEYFHIELDSHDVVFAEGAPTETYVDCDNRMMFANGAEYALLYPEDDRAPWAFCAPRLEEGSAELTAIRAALLERAEALGHALDGDPDLQLMIDGQAARPSSVVGRRYRFDIPAGSVAISLCSRSTVPAEVEAGSLDRRRLGVAVERIALRDADFSIEAWHSHAALREGFHEDEGSHRWTDGLAHLPATWLRSFPGAFTLEVHLIPSELGYRLAPTVSIGAVAA